jgi:lipooligosaccharide transport system permease protein
MIHSKPLYPRLWKRIGSVWFRHMRVYTKNLISNGLPPFLEPLIFLLGIGIGLGSDLGNRYGMSYTQFLAPGLFMTTAMFTAAFECSFGTFIRLEFDKIYDGMLAAPLSANNILIGEILWAGSKGFFFSLCVLIVVSFFNVLPYYGAVFVPFMGFVNGIMFGALGLLVTSFIRTINHFNFFFTGVLSPMFFFSGVVFPVEKLPAGLREAAEIFPLTHTVRITRALCMNTLDLWLLFDITYIVLFTGIVVCLAVMRLKKRLID